MQTLSTYDQIALKPPCGLNVHQPSSAVLRVYVRDAIADWRRSDAHLLGPYNVTFDVVLQYVVYLLDAVQTTGFMVPSPEVEFNLKSHFVKDFFESGYEPLPDELQEATDISDAVCKHVINIYHQSVPHLRDIMTQPTCNFRFNVAGYDDVSVYYELINIWR